jgi:hypothetical protein
LENFSKNQNITYQRQEQCVGDGDNEKALLRKKGGGREGKERRGRGQKERGRKKRKGDRKMS